MVPETSRESGTTAKQKPICPLETDEIDICSHQITAQDTWNKCFGKNLMNKHPKNTYAASSSAFRMNIAHMSIPNSVETENDWLNF